jgi:mannan endo-1,4-beta-mannosidase
MSHPRMNNHWKVAFAVVAGAASLLVTLAAMGAASAPVMPADAGSGVSILRCSGSSPDVDALGHYHFEHTTQGWITQLAESKPGITVTVTTTTATAWTGDYSLRISAGSDNVIDNGWRAAASVDYPAPCMTPSGTLTAHVYLPLTTTVTWAQFYILDKDWAHWFTRTVPTQPGRWVTVTWNLTHTTLVRPINRFGIQFGGAGSGPLDDDLYLDTIDWTQPAYTQPIYTGAYLSGTGTISFADELDCLDDMGGKHAGLINVFVGWTGPFPTHTVNTILAHQSTPMITWEPWVPLTDVVDGVHDAYINEWANAISQTQSTVFLRWGHEMNLCIPRNDMPCWYPWGGDPQAYKAAWQHVHDCIEITNGVKNAVWVWAPNHQSVPDEPWNEYQNYYPGDGYVDWVGTSGFNAANKATWTSTLPCFTFDDIFSPILHDMAGRYAKPQMVAEFASACDNGCDKALWIAEAYHQALSHPRLQALVWFNVAKWEGEEGQRKWVDWRVGCGDCEAPACPDCIAAYARALANPCYSAMAPGHIVRKLYLPLTCKDHN